MRTGQCHTTIFPDFSPAITIRRKAFNPVLKKTTALGLQPFLTYPVVIKLWHKGEQKSFDSPQKAGDFISSLSQQKTYAAALGTITIFCCSIRPMFSVMCGLSCSYFMVVGCSCFYVVFIFYNRHLYFYLFYPISKRIFI